MASGQTSIPRGFMVPPPKHEPSLEVDENSDIDNPDNNDTHRDSLGRSERGLGLSYDTHFSARAVVVGLAIGVLLCFCNVYFGLQTGSGIGLSIPASIMGFAIFKAMSRQLKTPFTPVENVLIQTVAGATGTMPLGSGFTGVMPAIEFLLDKAEGSPIDLSLWRLLVWSLGISLFGVIFAVPLRREVIVRERLKFPTGTATAVMIGLLHAKTRDKHTLHQSVQEDEATHELLPDDGSSGFLLPTEEVHRPDQEVVMKASGNSRPSIRILSQSFGVSGLYVRPHQSRQCEMMLTVARHLSRTLCLRSEICQSSVLLWPEIGSGHSIRHQPMLAKASLWDPQLLFICFSEQPSDGASYRL